MMTDVVDGVRINTLWTPKDTSAMAGTVMRGGAMLVGTVAVPPHVTEGYSKVSYYVYSENGKAVYTTNVKASLSEYVEIVSTYMYNGIEHFVFKGGEENGIVKLEVRKTLKEGEDPEADYNDEAVVDVSMSVYTNSDDLDVTALSLRGVKHGGSSIGSRISGNMLRSVMKITAYEYNMNLLKDLESRVIALEAATAAKEV